MSKLTRRRLLALLPAATASLHAQTVFQHKAKARPEPVHPLAYFGTDTARPGAKGIYAARFDPVKGQFTQPALVAETMRPVYLAWNTVGSRRVMYATNEGDAQTSSMSTFLADPVSGALKLAGQVPTAGAGPCFVGVATSGRNAYIANYNGGTVTAYQVERDGTLSQPMQCIDFHGEAFGTHGPNAARQDGPHPHSAMLSPDERFVIVNDLGSDTIVTFPILDGSGKLGAPTVTHTRVAGSGPRHVAFHPNGRWVYGIDELTSQIDCYLWNATHGTAGLPVQALLTATGVSLSTLAEDFHGTNTAAEIAVSPNGFYVYASNRGEDSLVVFKVNQSNGSLTFLQRISCGGKGPRHFTLDPTGNWIVCGNQMSDSVTVFARNPATGMLAGPVQTVRLGSPVFTLFA